MAFSFPPRFVADSSLLVLIAPIWRSLLEPVTMIVFIWGRIDVMSPNLVAALAVVKELSSSERDELIDLLLDESTDPCDAEHEPFVLSEAWREETRRRTAEYEAGLAETVTLEEFRMRWLDDRFTSRSPVFGQTEKDRKESWRKFAAVTPVFYWRRTCETVI